MWPKAPMQTGIVYRATDPQWGTEMVAMSDETFTNFGTQMEQFRRAAQDAHKKLTEKEAVNQVLAAQVNDLTTRLQNLRAADRKLRQELVKYQVSKLPEGDT